MIALSTAPVAKSVYIFTCVDYAVHFVACKHIHLVRMQISNDVSDEEFLTILTELYNENTTTGVTESAIGGDSSLSHVTLGNEDHIKTEQDATEEESHLEYFSRILPSTTKGSSLLQSKELFQQKVAEMQILMDSCSDMNSFFCDSTLVICNRPFESSSS